MTEAELLSYLTEQKLGVIGTVAADGSPQAALIGLAATPTGELIFDTDSRSRKHGNLLRDPRASVVLSGPGEQTVQYEGVARLLSPEDAAFVPATDAYYAVWPDGRRHLHWQGLVYWVISPCWVRYADYNRGPLIAEFRWSDA